MKPLTLALGAFLILCALSWAEKPHCGCYQERVVIRGRVVEIKHPIALVAGEDGKTYRIRLGPYWFWKEKGYRLKEGLFVRVVGLRQGRLIFPIIIETGRDRILIRDECGLPLWRHR